MSIMLNSCVTNPRALRPWQRGISIIELMVGMVIGLLTVLVVANTIILSEGQRRGTTTGADAQNNATIAAYLMERDLRMAGFGIFTNEQNGISRVCSVGAVRTYNANRPLADLTYDANLPFVPVLINPPALPPADPGSDIVFLNFAGSSLGVVSTGASIASTATAVATTYKVDNTGGFRAGDLILATQSGSDCSLYEATGIDTANSSVLRITTTYHNDYTGGNTTPAWNKAGGLGVDYSTTGKLYNLGPPNQFTSVAYALRGGQLTRCDLMTSDCLNAANVTNPTIWVPIASNIVALRAEVGVDTDGDQNLDAWRAWPCGAAGSCATTYDEWARVKTIRLAVVARSTQYSKEAVTTTAPNWQGQTPISISGISNWQHYRYGMVELVVPARNIVLWSTL